MAAAQSDSAEIRLTNARQLAYAAQLKATRAKLGEANDEISSLKAQVAISEDRLKATALSLRVEDARSARSDEKLEKYKKRAKEMSGRLLRLQEEHEVLQVLRDEPQVSYRSVHTDSGQADK